MLAIAPEKVAFIIVEARAFDAKVASWDEDPSLGDAETDPAAILEDFREDGPSPELTEFIDALNVDEKEALVALTWIGRGTYSVDQYEDALKMARTEHINKTSDYLLGMPLLSDYLSEGLAQMGYDVEKLEEDVLRPAPDSPSPA